MMGHGLIKRIQDALGTSETGVALVNVARQARADQQRLAGCPCMTGEDIDRRPLYLANWATDADFDAMRDDGGYDNVADMASPTGMIVCDLTATTVKRLLDHVVEEVKAIDAEDFPSDAKWERVLIGDSLNQWNLTCNDGDIYAVLIVRKEETIL